jgi:hypothetical protein
MIFRDVCLKISKQIMRELKNEMYYPSTDLINKVLKHYGLHYDLKLDFPKNY